MNIKFCPIISDPKLHNDKQESEPKRRRFHFKIEFEMLIPENATDDEIDEWLRFELNDNGEMAASCLSRESIEPIFGTLYAQWEDREE